MIRDEAGAMIWHVLSPTPEAVHTMGVLPEGVGQDFASFAGAIVAQRKFTSNCLGRELDRPYRRHQNARHCEIPPDGCCAPYGRRRGVGVGPGTHGRTWVGLKVEVEVEGNVNPWVQW